jgi:ribosomal-protein-alanine N-acetyltransferase
MINSKTWSAFPRTKEIEMIINLALKLQAQIRNAQEGDLPKIMEIEHLSFGVQWDYYDFKASLKDVFRLYLNRLEHNIVGFIIACCNKLSQRGIIIRLAVHPDYRGQGIATALIQDCFEQLKNMDLHEVELDVNIINAGAVCLYKRVGFQVVQVVSPSAEEDDSFYIMRKKLE